MIGEVDHFQIPAGRGYIFPGEISIQNLSLFLNKVNFFLILNSPDPLYILEISLW